MATLSGLSIPSIIEYIVLKYTSTFCAGVPTPTTPLHAKSQRPSSRSGMAALVYRLIGASGDGGPCSSVLRRTWTVCDCNLLCGILQHTLRKLYLRMIRTHSHSPGSRISVISERECVARVSYCRRGWEDLRTPPSFKVLESVGVAAPNAASVTVATRILRSMVR